MTNLQLRDVPEDLAVRARSRASKLEMSLSTYLRTLLEADIAAHAWDDWALSHQPAGDEETTHHGDRARADAVDADAIEVLGAIRAGRTERAETIERAIES
jgi:hypothetical protein